MSCSKSPRSGPEGGKGASIVEDVHVETVFHIVVSHESEHIIVDVAEIMNLMIMSLSR